ncbi:MAG: hypothetical protein IJL69_06820 [Oscillospiraceae bacterium]|nr:hypothetical protein [Oscillospiraceae bacterium]
MTVRRRAFSAFSFIIFVRARTSAFGQESMVTRRKIKEKKTDTASPDTENSLPGREKTFAFLFPTLCLSIIQTYFTPTLQDCQGKTRRFLYVFLPAAKKSGPRPSPAGRRGPVCGPVRAAFFARFNGIPGS